jgi:hypothetical protein
MEQRQGLRRDSRRSPDLFPHYGLRSYPHHGLRSARPRTRPRIPDGHLPAAISRQSPPGGHLPDSHLPTASSRTATSRRQAPGQPPRDGRFLPAPSGRPGRGGHRLARPASSGAARSAQCDALPSPLPGRLPSPLPGRPYGHRHTGRRHVRGRGPQHHRRSDPAPALGPITIPSPSRTPATSNAPTNRSIETFLS